MTTTTNPTPLPPDLAALVARLRELMAKATPGALTWERIERDRFHPENGHYTSKDALATIFQLSTEDDGSWAEVACEVPPALAALIVETLNALPQLLAALSADAGDGWRDISTAPVFEDRPFRQLIVVEGTFLQLDTGARFRRRHAGEATAHKFGPHGYRADDIERLRIAGGMDAVERVTHWRPMIAPPACPRPAQEGG